VIDYRLGNVDDVLDGLPDKSVHTCVTSPPYYGLRQYGGGKDEVGQEDTPDAFVARLVGVFRKVRRVLRDDGTLWLNLGDSWNSAPVGRFNGGGFRDGSEGRDFSGVASSGTLNKQEASGLPPKNLLGIPWRVALALQADGWYLRQDIIWAKGACMPESVQDRFTKSHEYVFLLSKSERYFFDNVAVKEPVAESTRVRLAQNVAAQTGSTRVPGKNNGTMKTVGDGETRNRRSVWTINPRGFKGAHFAVYPPDLPEICIRAGTSEAGCCTACGKPWKRQAEGFQAACRCDAPTTPCVVLDPFGGAGTTSLVAEQLGRDSVYIDLNPDYLALAIERWGQEES
jgi:DNA modification methylase